MSGTINSLIATNVTLGSVEYPSPLTITATGTVAPPASAGSGLVGVFVPAIFSGSILNDGLVLGGAGGFGVPAGDGIDIANTSTLSLGGTGTIDAAQGFAGSAVAGKGGTGVYVGPSSTLINGAFGVGGNTIRGGIGGVGSGAPGAGGGGGGGGLIAYNAAFAQNFGLIIGGAGGYGTGFGGSGAYGVRVSQAASLDNQGTVIGGYGGASATYCGAGGVGVSVIDGASMSNSAVIIGGNGTSNGPVSNSAGGSGVALYSNGVATNTSAGTITGGNGGGGTHSARGGYGVLVSSSYFIGGDSLRTITSMGTFGNAGLVKGGTGGYGGVAGYGGQGGAGLRMDLGVSFTNAGTVIGGDGGTGALQGGAGGLGLVQLGETTLVNAGLIRGGQGGLGPDGGGGTGLALEQAGAMATNNGTIAGGNSAYNAAGNSGYGGTGASVDPGVLTNNGLILGGNAGGVGSGAPAPGKGGEGVYLLTGGTVINHGTIGGGTGAAAGGAGVYIRGGILVTDGTISGGLAGTVQADAVFFGADPGGVLEIDPGAVFNGLVAAAHGDGDVLALGGSSVAALTSIGTEFLSFDTLSFLSGATWTAEGNSAGLAGGITIDGFAGTDTIVLDGFTATSKTYVSGTGLELSDGTSSVTLDIAGAFSTGDFVITDVAAGTEIQLLCFLKGTRILTPTGERAVESLAIGELVMTRFSGMQRIKWIGRQSHAAALAREDAGKRPVCIRAGALGEGVPARDLFVSPGHSMLVEGNLLLAGLLVNGVTVTQEWCPELVEYYNIELETHDCVVAEGAFAETYADCGEMRGQFGNAASFHALYPGYRPPEEVSLCAPRPERGARLEAALRPVLARAAAGPGTLAGWLDLISAPWTVEGWARDEAHPELPVVLEFLLDGEVLGTAVACHFRGDLTQDGRSSGRHGFRWTAPCTLPADAAARLHVRRAGDGAALPNSAPAVRKARARLRAVA
jgi:hypothetical protein